MHVRQALHGTLDHLCIMVGTISQTKMELDTSSVDDRARLDSFSLR